MTARVLVENSGAGGGEWGVTLILC